MSSDRCFDYTQGRCNRGDDCKFVHTTESQPRGQPTCYDFSIGKCDRGDDCKFIHADEHIPSRTRRPERERAPPPRFESDRRNDRHLFHSRRDDRFDDRRDRHEDRRPARREVQRFDRQDDRRGGQSSNRNSNQSDRCFDFTQGKCNRGDNCRFMHPETCFDFSVNKCDRDDCRFFHADVHTPKPRTRETEYRNPAPRSNERPSARSYQPIREREREPRREEREERERDQPNRCFDFTQGRCTRGDNCRFVHPETCYDFSIGKCTRDNCRFLHVPRHQGSSAESSNNPRACYDFSQDKCTRGDSCKFSHDPDAPKSSRGGPY